MGPLPFLDHLLRCSSGPDGILTEIPCRYLGGCQNPQASGHLQILPTPAPLWNDEVTWFDHLSPFMCSDLPCSCPSFYCGPPSQTTSLVPLHPWDSPHFPFPLPHLAIVLGPGDPTTTSLSLSAPTFTSIHPTQKGLSSQGLTWEDELLLVLVVVGR